MANNEFKDIDQFIEGFTRNGHTPEIYTYDGVIFGIEFCYKNKIYRITRDPTGFENELRIKFNKNKKAYIQFFEIPKSEYPNASGKNIDMYLGFYDSVDELLYCGSIDNVKLRDILISDQTKILAIDWF